jgi:hypothetical protein
MVQIVKHAQASSLLDPLADCSTFATSMSHTIYKTYCLLQFLHLVLGVLRLLPLLLFLQHVVNSHLVLLELGIDSAELALCLETGM